MTSSKMLRMMTRYMAWADDIMLENASLLSEDELMAERDTLFGSISGTFDHILVIGEVFQAHLEGRTHSHKTRYRLKERPFSVVAEELRFMNEYYVRIADGLSDADLEEVVEFSYVDGGEGAMTKAEILLHLVNHATYHRGFISTLLYPYKLNGRANDLTVFLRDVWPTLASDMGENPGYSGQN